MRTSDKIVFIFFYIFVIIAIVLFILTNKGYFDGKIPKQYKKEIISDTTNNDVIDAPIIIVDGGSIGIY